MKAELAGRETGKERVGRGCVREGGRQAGRKRISPIIRQAHATFAVENSGREGKAVRSNGVQ